jgi:hypothetical protein
MGAGAFADVWQVAVIRYPLPSMESDRNGFYARTGLPKPSVPFVFNRHIAINLTSQNTKAEGFRCRSEAGQAFAYEFNDISLRISALEKTTRNN